MTSQDRLRHVADRLDRLAGVSIDVLAEAVMTGGACITAMTSGEPPELTGNDTADRELARRLCSVCWLQEECLELELRWSGEHTVGVFGALGEDDRRALYPVWRARRLRATGGDR